MSSSLPPPRRAYQEPPYPGTPATWQRPPARCLRRHSGWPRCRGDPVLA